MARPGKGFDGFARGAKQFEEMGIPVPPVPEKLMSRMHVIEDWCFATRDIRPMTMYFFNDYILQGLTGHAPDYLAFSWTGYGINSYSVNYHLVDGPLALFVQGSFGGRYSDAGRDAEALRELFGRCGTLIEAHRQAVERGRVESPGRLVVCESGFRGIGGWAWLDEPIPTQGAAEEWLKAQRHLDEQARPSPIDAATKWLQER